VPLEAVTPGKEHAALLAGAAWGAVVTSGGPRNPVFRHFPAALDRTSLAALPLPSGGSLRAGQLAATLGDAPAFERHRSAEALRTAYEHRPTTRIYEDIGWGDEQGWAWLAGEHLTRLAGTGPRVTVAVYESAYGDQEMDRHRDHWLGIVFQVRGAKDWQAGDGLFDAGNGTAHRVTMTAGDALVVPKGFPHVVTTPADPGLSVHLAFAFYRDTPGAGEGGSDFAPGRAPGGP
jgi:hypothetical protein